jgi:hypothetical protein
MKFVFEVRKSAYTYYVWASMTGVNNYARYPVALAGVDKQLKTIWTTDAFDGIRREAVHCGIPVAQVNKIEEATRIAGKMFGDSTCSASQIARDICAFIRDYVEG